MIAFIEWTMSRVFIVIAVFLSPFVSSAEDNEGVLRVYPSPTQIGTTACREFKDEKGRLTKCIYYGMSIGGDGVQSTVTYDYDESDRLLKAIHYHSNGDLSRTLTYEYFADGSKRGTWRNAQGIRTYVMSYMAAPRSRKYCDLYFDDTGERLIHARGVLPPDMDLADGWGKSLHGLRCGLGVSTKQGTLDEVKVAVTIRNDGVEDGRLPLGSLYYKPRLIGQNGAVFKAGDIKHAKLNAHALKKPFPKQSVDSGEVETRDSPRPLSDWFTEIPPGEYQLRVVHPDPDGDMSLVSNRITIVITK